MTGSAFEAMDVVSRVPEAASKEFPEIIDSLNRGGSLRGERGQRLDRSPAGGGFMADAKTAVTKYELHVAT